MDIVWVLLVSNIRYMDIVWVLLVSKVGHLVFLQASNVDFLCCHKFDFNKVGFFISNIA